MSDPVYDVIRDLVVPALSGIGAIIVGTGAMVAAFYSYGLARRVRDDEQRRESAAALDRYRDQLFQTVEAAMTAMLSHRSEVARYFKLGTTEEGELRSSMIARLWIASSVAKPEHAKIIEAVLDETDAGLSTGVASVAGHVEGDLVIALGTLLSDGVDLDALLRRVRSVVAKRSAGTVASSAATSPPPPAP